MSREKNEYVTPAEVINRKHLCRADLVRNHGNIPKVRKIKVEPFPFSIFTLIFIIPLSLLDIILKLRLYYIFYFFSAFVFFHLPLEF